MAAARPNAVSNDSLKGALENVKRKYPRAFITQSFLRFEKSIQSAGVNTVKFDILSNEGQANSTERRLQITDRFIVTSWALFIQKAGTTTTATAAQRAIAALRTWPNPNIFTIAAEYANLRAVYNGYLRAIIDKDVVIDAFDTDRFLRVPDVQKGTLLYTTAPAGGTISEDGWYDTHQAFAKLTPLLILNGAGSNELTLNLPESVDLQGTSTQNFVVLKVRGFLAQNASTLNG